MQQSPVQIDIDSDEGQVTFNVGHVTFSVAAVWHRQGGWEECLSNSRFALSKRRFTVMGLGLTTRPRTHTHTHTQSKLVYAAKF